MPDQSSNASVLRADGHQMQVYLSALVDTANPVLVGTLSATPSVTSALNLSYTTTSGSSAAVRAGMRVVIETAGGAYKGTLSVRFAGTISSTNLPVREFSEGHVQAASGDVLKVYNDFVLTDRLVAATETFDPDYETYVDQNGTVKPIPCSGGPWAGFVDSGQTYATITLYGAESYTIDEDSAGSVTHLWTLPTGVTFAPGSSSTDVSPTVRATVGYYVLQHDVTDSSNSKSDVQYVALRVHDATHLPYDITLSTPITGEPTRGFNFAMEVYENAELTALPDLCPVVLWAREHINGSVQSLGHKVSGRSHLLCVGYLRRDQFSIDSTGASPVRFEVVSPLARLFELPGFSKVMDRVASPDGWSEVEALTVKRGIVLLLRYYTNAPQLFDIVFDGFSDANYPALYLQKKTPGDQAAELVDSRGGRLAADQTGRLEVQRRLDLTPLDERAGVTTTFTLTEEDCILVEVEREHIRPVETHHTRGYTAGTTVAEALTVFAKWAGSPNSGSSSPVTERLIVDDTTDLYEQAAMRGAAEDRVYFDSSGRQYHAPRVTVTLPGAYWGLFRFYREYVLLDLDETTNARGLDLTVFKFIPVSVELDVSGGTGRVKVVLQAATYAIGAVDDTPPDNSSMVAWPDITFPTATIPIATTRSLIAYDGDAVPTKLLILARSSAQVAVAKSLDSSGTFTYTEVSTGLSGNGVVASADPFDYETYFVVTETGLYRGKPFAETFAGWTLVADNATMWGNASYYAGRMLMSINRRGWIYLASGSDGQAYSTDYGATWTQVGTGGTGTGAFGCDVVVSPFNDGSSAVGWLYKSVYAGSGNSSLYKSTNWGATWSHVRNQYSGWRCARMNIPYKRGAAGSGADNINDTSQWLYWQGGGGHSVNGGVIYLSTNAGVTFGTTIFSASASGIKVPASSPSHTSIQTFTYDGDIIFAATLQTGAGGDAGGLKIFDATTQTYDSGTQLSSSNDEVCVNGFSYGSQAALFWSVTQSEILYTYDGGTSLHNANIPSFFTGAATIAYVEWPLVDFAR